jgi:hypothetical protein
VTATRNYGCEQDSIDPARTAGSIEADGAEPYRCWCALGAELRRTISGEVRFEAGSKALYATDGSNYRQVPIGVVIPRSKEDVIQAVAACRKFRAPSSFAWGWHQPGGPVL